LLLLFVKVYFQQWTTTIAILIVFVTDMRVLLLDPGPPGVHRRTLVQVSKYEDGRA